MALVVNAAFLMVEWSWEFYNASDNILRGKTAKHFSVNKVICWLGVLHELTFDLS